MQRTRPRMAMMANMFALLAGAFASGQQALSALANSARGPSFGQRYGNNPRSYNGGVRSGAAAAKRASRRSRNIAKRAGRR